MWLQWITMVLVSLLCSHALAESGQSEASPRGGSHKKRSQRSTTSREKKAPSRQESFLLRVLSPANNSALVSDVVKVLVAVRAPKSRPVSRVVVRMGGREVAQKLATADAPASRDVAVKGSSCVDQDLPSGEQCFELPILLPDDDNLLTIHAESEAECSAEVPLRLRVHRNEAQHLKPKLYVLAVGISGYQDNRLSLQYAQKDAVELVRALTQQKGLLYRDVETRLLTNEVASKANILDAFQWLSRQSTSRDVAILFLAGHGMNDASSGRYYFLPHDAELGSMMRSMVSQDDIQTTLRSTPGKVLLFLDTCHSGNVLGQWGARGQGDIAAFARELSASQNGVVVFAASTSTGSSIEDRGNGFFTRALLEAIRGAASYVEGRPTTVNMLDLYLSERVKFLSRGIQAPTTSKPAALPDFPIFMPSKGIVRPLPIPQDEVYKKWWFWTLTGVALAGVATGIAIGTWPKSPDAPRYSISF